MVAPIFEERRGCLGEEGRGPEAAVALCEDDFVEEADGGVGGRGGLTLVDELVEGFLDVSISLVANEKTK